MTGKRKKRNAQLQDDAFEDVSLAQGESIDSTPQPAYDGPTSDRSDGFDEDRFAPWDDPDEPIYAADDENPVGEEEAFDEPAEPEYDEEEDDEIWEEEDDLEEPAPAHSSEVPGQSKGKNRKRVVLALAIGLVLVLGIVGLIWKMVFSANGFRDAQSAPLPAEPIDVAERERNQKNQPTDYADEEQMKTMNYDDVNSIYGLALKKQEENRQNKSPQDSVHQDPSVQRELDRSRELARSQNSRRNASTQSPSPRRAQEEYAATEDPFRNKVRDEYIMRSGFNTVKAEEGSNASSAARNQYQDSNTADFQRNQIESNDPIPGVVSGDQTITNGSRVMFRTLADAMIKGRFAPKGSILVGFAQVNSNRALFNITTLRLLATGEAVPIRMRALDLDMNEGLAVQSEKPSRQQAEQATNSALSQAAGQAAWSAGYSVNRATQVPVAGNALASLGAGLATAATTGRRREVRQKLNLQDGFKVFFVPVK